MPKILFDLIYCLLYGVIVWAARELIRVVVPYFTAKLHETQYSWAAQIIDNAVRAYEQLVVGQGQGEEKYKLVLNQVVQELNKAGIKLTEEQIAVLIEAAVHTMNTEAGLLNTDTIELALPLGFRNPEEEKADE